MKTGMKTLTVTAARGFRGAHRLQLRAVFIREGDTLKVQLIGDHNEVRRYLRDR